jgi:hypothetical protein
MYNNWQSFVTRGGSNEGELRAACPSEVLCPIRQPQDPPEAQNDTELAYLGIRRVPPGPSVFAAEDELPCIREIEVQSGWSAHRHEDPSDDPGEWHGFLDVLDRQASWAVNTSHKPPRYCPTLVAMLSTYSLPRKGTTPDHTPSNDPRPPP